jgi:DNA-directed RNA polymerase subunit RPC12/RpoP
MVFSECPGSKLIKQPVPEEIKCPFCQAEVEVWTNETKVRCTACGRIIFREMPQSCLDWCPYAEECVGPEKFREYKLGRQKNQTH